MKLKPVTKRKQAEEVLIHHGGQVTYHVGGPGTTVSVHINHVGDGDGVSLVTAVNDAIEEARKRVKADKSGGGKIAKTQRNGTHPEEKASGTEN